MRRRGLCVTHLFAVLVALALARADARANEVGATSITASIGSARYSIELTVDPDSLLAKLDARAGRPRQRYLTVPEYQARLQQHRDEFLRHVVVRFGDRPVRPAFDGVTPAENAAAAADRLASPRFLIRLSGDVPSGTRDFVLSYGLSFATYPLILNQAGTNRGRLEWIEGDRASEAFRFAPSLVRRRLTRESFDLAISSLDWWSVLATLAALAGGIRFVAARGIHRSPCAVGK